MHTKYITALLALLLGFTGSLPGRAVFLPIVANSPDRRKPTATLLHQRTRTPTPTAVSIVSTPIPAQSPTATSTPTQPPTPTSAPTALPQPTSSGSSGATYYVNAASGLDTNPGTPSAPWRTIQKCANTLSSGQICQVSAGNYPERVKITGSGVVFQAAGTAVTRGFTIYASSIRVTGFEIANAPDNWEDGWGVYVQGANNIIENNIIHDTPHGGITLDALRATTDATHDNLVRHNTITQVGSTGINVNGRNNRVENNDISHVIQHYPGEIHSNSWDADGMHFFGSGHTIRANYIHDILYTDPGNTSPHIDCFQTWDSATYNEVGHDIIFDGNICFNAQTHAMGENGQGWMIETNTTAKADHLVLRNNIVLAYRPVNAWDAPYLVIDNNTFGNDLSLTASYYPSMVGLTRSPNSDIRNNIFYNGIVYGSVTLDSASQPGANIGYNLIYRSDGGMPQGAHFPNELWGVNPNFINPSARDFHLQGISPAIDAGAQVSTVPKDIDMQSRPAGSGFDIGADEYVAP